MRDVSPSAFPVVKMIAANRGASLTDICEGVIGIREAETQGFDWNQFCMLLERLEELCGGPEGLQREGGPLTREGSAQWAGAYWAAGAYGTQVSSGSEPVRGCDTGGLKPAHRIV